MIIKSTVLSGEWHPALEAARGILPVHVQEKVRCPLLIGTQPTKSLKFCNYPSASQTDDSRHYDYIAHVNWENPSTMRNPVLILPRWDKPTNTLWDVYVIIHEWGHVLHSKYFDNELMDLPNITKYAASNKLEQFAEAFTWYVLGDKLFQHYRAWDQLEKPTTYITEFFNQVLK
jgi:hypothetical protein